MSLADIFEEKSMISTDEASHENNYFWGTIE
jgi:hypothetical protein